MAGGEAEQGKKEKVICAALKKARSISPAVPAPTRLGHARKGWKKNSLSWLGGSVQKCFDWTHLSFKMKMT
jgi:hypothetical protein